MQLTGNASVTNGSPNVAAALGVDWSQAAAGSWFTVAGSFSVYDVAAAPTFSGGIWHIALTANYAGVTNAAVAAVIHKDFGPDGEIIFAVGDTEILPLLNRWCRAIAQRLGLAIPLSSLATESGEVLTTESGESLRTEQN